LTQEKWLTRPDATVLSPGGMVKEKITFYFVARSGLKYLELRDKNGKTWFACSSSIWHAIGHASLLCDSFNPEGGYTDVDNPPNRQPHSAYRNVKVRVAAPYDETSVIFVLQHNEKDFRVFCISPSDAYILSAAIAVESGDLK
jgi:hypothetical protein